MRIEYGSAAISESQPGFDFNPPTAKKGKKK
jgi:hypothetical protein